VFHPHVALEPTPASQVAFRHLSAWLRPSHQRLLQRVWSRRIAKVPKSQITFKGCGVIGYLQGTLAFRLRMNRLVPILVGVALGASCQGSGISIDWVDLVQLHGVTYVAAWTSPGRPLQQGDLGAQFGLVKVKLAGSNDPNHQLQDGDSGFLDPGTAVYSLKGYAPSFRLAAYNQKRLTLYEADTNPKAKVGADLLDLVNKVGYIGINSAQDGRTELAAVHNQDQVNALVAMVLKASVDQTLGSNAGPQYFIDFHFSDGTETTRSYWLESGEMSRGILLPSGFANVVTDILSRAGAVAPTGQPGSFIHAKSMFHTRSAFTHTAAQIGGRSSTVRIGTSLHPSSQGSATPTRMGQ
jgi:hypothetical protein